MNATSYTTAVCFKTFTKTDGEKFKTSPGHTGPFYMHIQNSVIFSITQFYHATYSIAWANKNNKLCEIV